MAGEAMDAAQPGVKRPSWRAKLLVALLSLCALEGLSSLFLFAWDVAVNAERVLPERSHTLHDDELGWVNAKSVAAPDLYGPGRHFHTDRFGRRASSANATLLERDARVIVCAGDSFTLGYGVSDENTFPAQLERHLIDAGQVKSRTVNFGQGGYGIDQAYLWYLRDGQDLPPHDLVFAFIGDDFERLRSASFLGYAKPLLVLDGEPGADRAGLRPSGVPVSKGSLRWPWWTQNAKLFDRLRSFSLLRRAANKLGAAPPKPAQMDAALAAEVAARVFTDLAHRQRARGGRCVLVWLPNLVENDPARLVRPASWMRAAIERGVSAGAEFVDLSPPFEALDPAQRAELFLARDVVKFPGAAGHYSEAGNRFVAERLASRWR